jgi:wyosine [tRNA(Phe)-imidazoG37] synthetase (radical SAM superfamily)
MKKCRIKLNSKETKSYFYGPVPSRRLGFSLGVDLLGPNQSRKTCNFDCVYCQLGKTFRKQTERFFRIDFNKFKKELAEIIKISPKIDYISISGSGEPTLHKDLDRIIMAIKKITKNRYPVCVITNSSLLSKKEVRRELKNADLLIPSLDAVTPKSFYKINRPYHNLSLEKIIEGLIRLRKEFKGKIWLEIMLVANMNDSLSEAQKFKEIIGKIKPDKIQLNLPVRPSGSKIMLPPRKKIAVMTDIIGGNIEVVTHFRKKRQPYFLKNPEKQVLNFLKRRPATFSDLEKASGVPKGRLAKVLKGLLAEKEISKNLHQGKEYFVIA